MNIHNFGNARMSAKTGLCIEDLSVGQSATYTKTVTEADIVKFADISGDGRALHMRYVLPLVDDGAAPGAPARWILRGVKEVVRRRPWPTVSADTTTLFVDVWRDDARAAPVLRGVLREGLVGVLAQLSTFRGDLRGLVRYLGFYVASVVRVYAGQRHAPLLPRWQAEAAYTRTPVLPPR